MAPERRSNLRENILASYLYTYLHGTVPFFKCIREIKKPINLPLFKNMAMYVFDSTALYKVQYQKKNHKWEPNKQIKVS